MTTPLRDIHPVTHLISAFLFLGACNPNTEAAAPSGPLAFGPDLVAVTTNNTLGRRYRTWGDFDAELANYRREAEALAAQRGRPPLQSHALAVFLKNVAVTSTVSLDAAGNKTATALTPDSTITAWEHEKQRFADFMFAYTRGEVEIVWHSEIVTNRIDYPITGTNFAFQPKVVGDQLTNILNSTYQDQQVDVSFLFPGQAKTPNGTAVAGDGYAGMAYTAWPFYGGRTIRLEWQYATLDAMLHEWMHVVFDMNSPRSEGVGWVMHMGTYLGYTDVDLGWWSNMAHYRDRTFYYYPSEMWSRFTMTGTNDLSFPAFEGRVFAWSEVKNDFLKKLPIIGDAELRQLTGIPTAAILGPDLSAYTSFTVAASDQSKVLSPYTIVLSETDTNLNNLLSTPKESAAVLQTASGCWFFVKPDLAEVYVAMLEYQGISTNHLEVYGYVNRGSRPLICVKGPAGMPLPVNERELFWPAPGDQPPRFTRPSINLPDVVRPGSTMHGALSSAVNDPDPDSRLTFYKVTGPSWLTVSTNGYWFGIPGVADVGINGFKIRVTDQYGLFDEALMFLAVRRSDGTIVALAEADAYVRQETPGTRYGNVSILRVRSGATAKEIDSYLRFQVAGIWGLVSSVQLRIYAMTVNMNTSVQVVTDNSWSETDICWTNRPALGGLLDTQWAGTSNWVTFNLTSQIYSNGPCTFGLTGNTDAYTRDIGSRESSMPPTLEIVDGASEFFTNAPMISIQTTPSGCALVWPAGANFFQLCTTTNLAPPVAWAFVTNSPAYSNGSCVVYSQTPSNVSRFFRLQMP